MRYLLAGVAGFIGARVAQQLLDDGHEIIGIDSLNDAYDVQLKNFRLQQLKAFDQFRFYKIDITKSESLGSLISESIGCEAVINLAARAGVRASVTNPKLYFKTNVEGTLHLLDLCRKCNIEKFVLASTSSLYGTRNARPYREDADVSRPLSPYAASKLGAESLCHVYHSLYGIDVSVLRYFTVYGPGGRPDMAVFRFVQRIMESKPLNRYGNGEQSRDFTYIDDIARGTVASLCSVGFEVVNLGGDAPHSVNQLIELIESVTGEKAIVRSLPRHSSDVESTWADVTHAQRLLNWSPKIPLEQGIAQTVAWYEAHRDWAKAILTED